LLILAQNRHSTAKMIEIKEAKQLFLRKENSKIEETFVVKQKSREANAPRLYHTNYLREFFIQLIEG